MRYTDYLSEKMAFVQYFVASFIYQNFFPDQILKRF
jgi:hypothetical protein